MIYIIVRVIINVGVIMIAKWLFPPAVDQETEGTWNKKRRFRLQILKTERPGYLTLVS